MEEICHGVKRGPRGDRSSADGPRGRLKRRRMKRKNLDRSYLALIYLKWVREGKVRRQGVEGLSNVSKWVRRKTNNLEWVRRKLNEWMHAGGKTKEWLGLLRDA